MNKLIQSQVHNLQNKISSKTIILSPEILIRKLILLAYRQPIINLPCMKYLYLQGLRQIRQFTDDHTFMNHDVKLGNITPEKSLTYPRRNVLAHFIRFIDYVFPEVMLGDLSSGELNDMFEELSPQKQLQYSSQ